MPARKRKAIEKPNVAVTSAVCRACGIDRPIDTFRFYAATENKKLRMDFCNVCEREHGTLTLYRRFNAYGTTEIVEAVFRAERTPAKHRTPEMTRLLVEKVKLERKETAEEVIQQELERRELARRRLLYFVTMMMPTYKPGWVHQDICRRLERFVEQVAAGESPRLIIAMPPRAGKSQLASDMLPSWALGKFPEWDIILASYAQELPVKFSRSIRARIKDPEYNVIFPGTGLSKDSTGVEAWNTTKGGGVKAVGVGVGLTGHGGHILICDDLLKDAEAASSDTIRENTINWYETVARTRIAPGGGVLIIATRWHWNDPTGHVLEKDAELAKAGVPEYERENWELVSYPAIAEQDEYLMEDGVIEQGIYDEQRSNVRRLLRRKGDALHPERYPKTELLKIKNTSSSAHWSALYQQQPTPDEGDFFKREYFKYQWLDPMYRPLCRIFMCADYAIKKTQRSDYTVVGVYALTAKDDLYCLEKRRGRWGTYEIATNIIELIERHKPEVYAGEQGQIHAAVWPVVEKEMRKRRLFVTVDNTLVPIQDKEVRARPLQARMQRGQYVFSYDSATRPDVYDVSEREFLQFPNGAHDDCVDADAWAARLALNISLPQTQAPPKRNSWKDQLTQRVAGGGHMAA